MTFNCRPNLYANCKNLLYVKTISSDHWGFHKGNSGHTSEFSFPQKQVNIKLRLRYEHISNHRTHQPTDIK